jgi:hypothetical protein
MKRKTGRTCWLADRADMAVLAMSVKRTAGRNGQQRARRLYFGRIPVIVDDFPWLRAVGRAERERILSCHINR